MDLCPLTDEGKAVRLSRVAVKEKVALPAAASIRVVAEGISCGSSHGVVAGALHRWWTAITQPAAEDQHALVLGCLYQGNVCRELQVPRRGVDELLQALCPAHGGILATAETIAPCLLGTK